MEPRLPFATSAAAAYLGAFRKAIQPDVQLSVSDWADEYRVLSIRNSPEPGRWRTARTPYLRDVMDALSPSSPWEMVVLMAGSQIGKTETANNWLGYNMHIAPGPMLLVQPTVEMARRNSKQRIGPLIDDCKVLRDLVAREYAGRAGGSQRGGNSLMNKEFPGGVLVMTGANSSKGLRSMAARYLALDEVDGYPGDVDGEGDPCDLAIVRTVNFPRRKIFVTSTPVISGRSRIERFFEQSDQCQYFVPCPKCGVMQVLVFEQMRWPKGQPHKAVYECAHCHAELRDADKEQMLPHGEWQAQAAGDGVTRGYHLSSLYSPVGWLSWPQIAAKHAKSVGDAEKLQVFWNTVLGRPWMEIGETPDHERLYERREVYPIGRVPAGGLILTAGVDVQVKRIECEVVAWGRRKESWSVDYRVFDGDTQQPEVWRKVAEMLDEDFPSELGGQMRIAKLAVDSGFNTTAVYDFVRKMQASRAMAVKGDSHTSALIGAPNPVEVGPQGRRVKSGLRLWPVNSSIAKEELYRWLRSPMPNLEAGEQWPAGYCHFPQYSMEYFEQLTAEHLIVRAVGGHRKAIWEKRRPHNEALDCRVYARAAAASLRIETWTEKKWGDLEAALTVERSDNARPRSAVKADRPATSVPQFQAFKARESFLE
jgi:phage terminase large subunit GpA-like protein